MKVAVNGDEIFVGQGGMDWLDDRPVLVLQHGAGMNRTVWVLLARYFARHGYNVVAADLPGHGASEGQALGSIEQQAEHLWALLDTLWQTESLSSDRVVFAGHSMGALTVVEAAAQRPDKVEQLLLFGAAYPMPVAEALLDAAEANDQSAIDMISLFAHSFASQLGHNAIAGISVLNSAMAMLEQTAPGVLFADLQACNDYKGLENAASRLISSDALRVTVVSGDSDRMTPLKSARALAEQLQAKHIMIDNCGHMMMSEQPELTLQAVRSVLLQ
ncbi:MAG: alpha/beta hydrolase [Granulosicoccus sp.]|nr:alpha/beta hydrolase [Granulosicoccus sp.]